MPTVSTDCSGEKHGDRADLEDVDEHCPLNPNSPDLGNTRPRPENRYQPITDMLIR